VAGSPQIARISKDLHFVSQTVLSGVCNEGGFLERLDIVHPSSRPRLRTTAAVGYRSDLKPENPDEFEAFWQPMERSFPEAMDAVKDQTVLGNDRLMAVLRDCLVVHFARSNTIERVLRSSREPILAGVEASARDHPSLMSPEGLRPIGPEGRAEMAKRTMERIKLTTFRHELLAPQRMMAIYKDVTAMATDSCIEILTPESGEFLIGDTPAHTYHPELWTGITLLHWDPRTWPVRSTSRHSTL
jgi:hypothetical protein